MTHCQSQMRLLFFNRVLGVTIAQWLLLILVKFCIPINSYYFIYFFDIYFNFFPFMFIYLNISVLLILVFIFHNYGKFLCKWGKPNRKDVKNWIYSDYEYLCFFSFFFFYLFNLQIKNLKKFKYNIITSVKIPALSYINYLSIIFFSFNH